MLCCACCVVTSNVCLVKSTAWLAVWFKTDDADVLLIVILLPFVWCSILESKLAEIESSLRE